MYYRGAAAAIVVFSVTDKASGGLSCVFVRCSSQQRSLATHPRSALCGVT
jgi:hypothetical protein